MDVYAKAARVAWRVGYWHGCVESSETWLKWGVVRRIMQDRYAEGRKAREREVWAQIEGAQAR